MPFLHLAVYKEIFDAHHTARSYRFSAEAREIYCSFSDEIVVNMNKQLEEDIIISDNMSKDRKIFIR
jgi:hypothetical protein